MSRKRLCAWGVVGLVTLTALATQPNAATARTSTVGTQHQVVPRDMGNNPGVVGDQNVPESDTQFDVTP